MSSFNAWIYSIASISIICVLLELLISDSKMQKFITAIFGLIVLLVVIAPIPNLIKNGFNFNELFNENDINLDKDYLEKMKEIKIEKIKQGLDKIFVDNGIKNTEISINADFQNNIINITKISINISKVNYSGDLREKIYELTAQSLKIKRSIIEIHE